MSSQGLGMLTCNPKPDRIAGDDPLIMGSTRRFMGGYKWSYKSPHMGL